MPLVTTKTHHVKHGGLGRLELPTLRLSGVRSNHLSYRPLYHRKKARALVCDPREKRNVDGECPHNTGFDIPFLFYDEPI